MNKYPVKFDQCQIAYTAGNELVLLAKERASREGELSFVPVSAVLAGIMLAGMAYADEPNLSLEDSLFEEIIVTAQNREQLLIDIPLSVSVLTNESLKNMGATALEDVQYTVPSLQITEQNGNGSERITMRGISPPGATLPTVGRYFEEMPVNSEASSFGITLPFFDIDRVEILRGPQGTLYGEGSIGGTVRTITRKPSNDDLDGVIDFTGDKVDEGGEGYRLTAASNLPLDSDQFAVRVAGYYEEGAGYIDSPRFGKDINGNESWAVRTNVVWTPSDRVEVGLTYQHLDTEADGNNFSNGDFVSNLFVANPASGDKYDLANLVVRAEIGFVKLTSSTGWSDRETLATPDLSNVFEPLLLTIPGITEVNDIVNTLEHENQSFYQEFRLSSTNDGGEFWQIGISYRDASALTLTNAAPAIALPVIGTTALLSGEINSDIKAAAVYGDYTFLLNEEWEMTLGGRYYYDERTTFNPLNYFFTPLLVDELVYNDKFTGRASLNWHYSSNHIVYVSASQGFRSGGSQIIDVGLPLNYDPEVLTTYELGFKGEITAQAVQYELVFFFNDYDNVQTYAPNPLNLQAFDNGGRAEMKGFDLLISWHPVQNLSLSATYGYNDNEYTEPGNTHLEGDPMDYVSKATASASGDYTWNLSEGLQGRVRVDYQHADAYQLSLSPGTVVFDNSSIDVFNVRAGVYSASWSAYVFANNVNNEDGVVFPQAAQDREPVLYRPRTLGFTLQKDF